MKGKVGILLFAALIYLMDMVFLPSVMDTGKPTCMTCPMAHPCQTTQTEDKFSRECGMPTGKCNRSPEAPTDRSTGQCRQTGQTGSSGKKCDPRDCNNAANCVNCPLCFSATLAAAIKMGIPPLACRLNYPALPAARITGFYGKCWKPPDPGVFL